MFRYAVSYFLFGIGACGILFALARTYYLVWKLKKDRDDRPVRRNVDLKAQDGDRPESR